MFTTCWIFARGYYMVSLSIDEFHIFKAAHRSWTLLALARISNSRCYTPAEHTVSKNRFFVFVFCFLRITYLRKVLFALIAKTFLKVDWLWGVIWIFVIPHYFLYFKRALCRAQTMLWFLCHDQKKCILHSSHFTLFHRALMSVHKEVVWNIFWNPLLYF